MNQDNDFTDREWPPGTVRLATLLGGNNDNADIILQPRPTSSPNDPLNWSKWSKALNYGLSSFYAMMVYAFVNATSPTWGPLAEQLHFSDATLTNTYAIGCATLALGAPMLIPFALKFGARPVYLVSSVGQFAISIWAAKTENAADWWGVNATQCWLGALAEVLVQMTIADVFFVHQRGKMNAIYIWVLNVGMYLAIVAAGFVTVDQGWRWVWWWFTIFFGLQAIMFFFGFEETKYSHVETLADRQGSITAETPLDDIAGGYGSEKHEKSRVNESAAKTESGDVGSPLASQAATKLGEIHIDPTIPRKTYRQKLAFTTTSPGTWSQFLRHSYQPFMILVTIPGVTFCALVYGVNQAWSTVMTASQNTILLDPPYNFSASDIGLMSLGPFIGSTIGSLVSGPVSDYVAIRLAKANDGVYEPEFRFWVFLPFCPFMLGGAWWFGYALQNGWHWAQVVVAFGMFGFGAAPVQAISLTYMLDAYNEIIGDTLTAVTTVRNTLSTIFVFALAPWLASVGVGNVFNIMGAVGTLILSFAAVFIWRGKAFRVRTAKTYRYYASRQFEARKM